MFVLEKKRTIKDLDESLNPYWVERFIFFTEEDASAAAAADADQYRIYHFDHPPTLWAGDENF